MPNAATIGGTPMMILRYLLLAFTAAMLVLHLTSGPLVRKAIASRAAHRWLSVVNIVRFEAVYYAVLAWFVWSAVARDLLWPLLLLGTLHGLGWALAERKAAAAEPNLGLGKSASSAQIVRAVQAFDFAEAAALVYVGWVLIRRSVGAGL